jgi:hypothetical protein
MRNIVSLTVYVALLHTSSLSPLISTQAQVRMQKHYLNSSVEDWRTK